MTSATGLGEATAVFVLSTALCVVLVALQGLGPWLSEITYLFVALTFLYLPWFFISRRKERYSDYGFTLQPAWREVKLFLLVCLVVFPPYLLVFHLYEGIVFGLEPDLKAVHFHRWPYAWEGTARGKDEPGLNMGLQGEHMLLSWQGLVPPVRVKLGGDAPVEVSATMVGTRTAASPDGAGLVLEGRESGGARIDLVRVKRLRVEALSAGCLLPASGWDGRVSSPRTTRWKAAGAFSGSRSSS